MNETQARSVLKKHAAIYGYSQYEPARWVIDAMQAVVAAERDKWRLRVLGLQAKYEDPACRAALKHAVAYGSQDEA